MPIPFILYTFLPVVYKNEMYIETYIYLQPYVVTCVFLFFLILNPNPKYVFMLPQGLNPSALKWPPVVPLSSCAPYIKFVPLQCGYAVSVVLIKVIKQGVPSRCQTLCCGAYRCVNAHVCCTPHNKGTK